MTKTNDDIHVNKKYKDTVFRKLFGENGENALSLYNAVKYSLQGTTQGNGLTGGVPPVRFSM